ncbi:MAG: rRNA maturation RNase YbeY [Sedimentisphaerales bacterium]|nr:rRNA maturation RNase YbeY [Sedimentisphaerales bacterium]
MPPAKQGIIVQITQHFDGLEVRRVNIEKLVKAVCRRFALAGATVSIAVVDDRRFVEVSSRFGGKAVSDCLSFDLSENGQPHFELVVNGEAALREAGLRNHAGEAELALYITHGLLHNLGFDDATEAEARQMHQTEDEILQQLGYGVVYNTQIRTERRDRKIVQ